MNRTFTLLFLLLLFNNCRKVSYEMPPFPKQSNSFTIKKELYNLSLFDAVFHINHKKNQDSTWIEIKNLDHQYGAIKLIIEYTATENEFNYNNTSLLTKTIIDLNDSSKSTIIPIRLQHNAPFTENNFNLYVTDIENFENHALAGLYQSISSKFGTNHDSTSILVENYTIIETNGQATLRIKANQNLYNTAHQSLRQSNFNYNLSFSGSLYHNDQLMYELAINDTNDIQLSNNRLMLKYALTSSTSQPFQYLATYLQKL